jgi:Oligoendopeptidase F
MRRLSLFGSVLREDFRPDSDVDVLVEYAFGMLLVLALYRRWCEEGDAFMPWYLELLSAGGSEAPATMLARVGIDVRNPTFWKRGLEHVGNLIDQFETVAYA